MFVRYMGSGYRSVFRLLFGEQDRDTLFCSRWHRGKVRSGFRKVLKSVGVLPIEIRVHGCSTKRDVVSDVSSLVEC